MIDLLDTSVAIDYLRGREAALAVVDAADELVASEITRYEVLVGMKRGEEEVTEDLLALPGWVPVDEWISRRAAALAREHRAAHSGIEDTDYLLAATALELDARLLTTNVKHFPMLPGLEPAY
ncbi:MAG TPA: type II toxin-antitoxin system VapC family toxin [Gaiellaceae bacterium]|nr:type II toxin-antitoxin system VapC family toxin [Gaiellaceae bacterium]